MCLCFFPGSCFRFARSLDRGRKRLLYLSAESLTVPVLAKSDQVWKKSTCYRNQKHSGPFLFSYPVMLATNMQWRLNWSLCKRLLGRQQQKIPQSQLSRLFNVYEFPLGWYLLIFAQSWNGLIWSMTLRISPGSLVVFFSALSASLSSDEAPDIWIVCLAIRRAFERNSSHLCHRHFWSKGFPSM